MQGLHGLPASRPNAPATPVPAAAPTGTPAERRAIDASQKADRAHAKALSTAHDFEAMLARTMVAALRQTGDLGDEDGGMFGSGPGADTFTDWFDERFADEITTKSRLGVAEQLLPELEHLDKKAMRALTGTARSAQRPIATPTPGLGGVDVSA